MTIWHALSADGLAILALTARSPGGRVGGRASGTSDGPEPDGPNPLSPRDWARVARALSVAGATPADLLGRETADVAALLGGAPAAAEAITRLAARATTL
ncbi:MAG TPA: hypothetical protein VLH81_03105, partial [Desulfobacterales bacterium]|nr:hypothetical protein [Desulfobacterales bacterium]